MQHVINILNAGNDNMGASFKSLIDALEHINNISPGDEVILNLKRITFIHPFLVLPLSTLVSDAIKNNITFEIQYSNLTKNYLNTIHFPDGFDATYWMDWADYLNSFHNKSFLPICKIPVKTENNLIREKLLSTFENIALKQLNITGQMVTVIKYLISEAMDNIVEHANTDNGWIMVQNFSNKGFLDICILDSGIGLLGSYKNNGINDIDNDTKALEQAINGNSTKKITETRGYGIDTSRRMLVEGLKGKYFLLTGAAFYIYTSELEQITPINVDSSWKGTMLALRIPKNIPPGFVYTNYLE
jgi:anti-sigma regulatory factor (Ser/Thr protein kinase)